MTEASLIKGLLSTAIGLLITVIGTDPIGSVPRFTFGSEFIGGGFPFLPVLIGIFAFAQIMTDMEKMRRAAERKASAGEAANASKFSHLKVIGRSSAGRSCCCGRLIVGHRSSASCRRSAAAPRA